MNSDAYDVLGLTPDADIAVVKAAYRTLSKQNHPDQGGDEEEFKHINEAYEAIINDKPYSDSSTDENGGASNNNGLFDGLFSSEPVETKSSTGIPDHGITIEGDYMTASVVGLQHNADVRELVHDHQIEERPGHHRTVILYDLHNTSDQVLRWSIDDSKYIGSDTYTYTHSEYFVDESGIQAPWTAATTEIEGGTRSRFIEVVEKMPEDVVLSKIVHTLSVHEKGRTSGWVKEKERMEFVIDETDLPALAEPPV